MYREPAKGLQILLSRTQAGPGRAVKEEQEEISPNHVQAIYGASVVLFCAQLRRPARPGDIPMDGGKNGCFPILTPVLDPVPPLSLPLSFSPLLSSPPACPGARPSVSVADVNSCVMSRHIAIPIQPSLSLSLSLVLSLSLPPQSFYSALRTSRPTRRGRQRP